MKNVIEGFACLVSSAVVGHDVTLMSATMEGLAAAYAKFTGEPAESFNPHLVWTVVLVGVQRAKGKESA